MFSKRELVPILSAVTDDERQLPLQFAHNHWNHDSGSCGLAHQSANDYNQNIETVHQKVYKAKEGFIIKQQVSDLDKHAYVNRPIFVGVMHG